MNWVEVNDQYGHRWVNLDNIVEIKEVGLTTGLRLELYTTEIDSDDRRDSIFVTGPENINRLLKAIRGIK